MSNLNEARALLLDNNLVWSEDFERIREPLARVLNWEENDQREERRAIFALADAIVEAEVTAPDPLEQWVWDAARQLGIVHNLAERSSAMAEALKKLFSRL